MALLSLGSSGSDVVELQKKLTQLGLFSGTASGTFDAATRDAAMAFQKQYPWLLIDGIVGDMTLGEINDAVSEIDGQAALEAFVSSSSSLSMTDLNKKPLLCLAIQRRLRSLGLYPGGKLVDGDFGPLSQEALKRFCTDKAIQLAVPTPFQFQSEMARKLLNTLQISSVLAEASDQKQISKEFLRFEDKVVFFDPEIGGHKLGFLDMGATKSPFKKYVHQQANFLSEAKTAALKTSPPPSLTFSSYPEIGKIPPISNGKLTFLASDITEACICLGEFNDSTLKTSWLGHDATVPLECLSATKIIPILNVLSKIGDKIPSNPTNLILTRKGNSGNESGLPDVLIDICSYRISVPHSNALAGTLNAFEGKRENWIKKQTGNPEAITFGGKYFEPQISKIPEIRDKSINKPIVEYQKSVIGGNDISVYDLTRLISFVGWNLILPKEKQISGIADRGIELAVTALSTDTARYVDTAMSTLGLENVVDSLVVLSKMGYGESAVIYTAFVQFIDKHDAGIEKLRTFSMTLRAAKDLRIQATKPEEIRVDSAIATAVTEIIRRVVTEDF